MVHDVYPSGPGKTKVIRAVRKLSAKKTLEQDERGHCEKSGAQKGSAFTRPVGKGGKSET